jgi:hypothetical protein
MSSRSAAQYAALLPEIKQRPLEAYSDFLKEAGNDHDG